MLKAITAVAVAGGVMLSAAPAMASDKGLYGAGDATYDGVYRQSLAILGLKAADKKVPKSAIKWLKSQQCANGGFVEYKPSASAPCPKQNPSTLAGRDLNGTALAVAALMQTGNRKRARKAARWIARQRQADGGYAYVPGPGATSDTNSTALAIGAIRLAGKKASTKYLRSRQSLCSAPISQRGGLTFDSTSTEPNNGATAMTAWSVGGAITVPDPDAIKRLIPRLDCDEKDRPKLVNGSLRYLYQALVKNKGQLEYGGGYPGVDYAATAQATIALAYAGKGRNAVRKGTRFLKRDSEKWITSVGPDSPAALGLLIMLAESTGENPRKFGGQNLVRRLVKTQQ